MCCFPMLKSLCSKKNITILNLDNTDDDTNYKPLKDNVSSDSMESVDINDKNKFHINDKNKNKFPNIYKKNGDNHSKL